MVGPLASQPGENGGWRIATVHGRSLHSPDLATLHRWIIERRVTREDRISSDGVSWQRVGEVADLVPFFDIVDSAERARRADTPGPMRLPSPPPVAVKAPPPPPVVLDPGAFPQVEDRTETKLLRTRASRFSLPLKLGLTTLVAAAVAYTGISVYGVRTGRSRATTTPPPVPVAAIPLPPPPTIPPAPPPEPAAELVPNEHPAEAAAPVHPTSSHKRARARVAVVRATKAAPTAAGATSSGSPQAAAAQGYAALNRRQYDQAIVHFKQALAGNPSNGTALFGLAEAYRETGQKVAALKAYKRYVQILPSGPDAGSARLQIRLLEAKK